MNEKNDQTKNIEQLFNNFNELQDHVIANIKLFVKGEGEIDYNKLPYIDMNIMNEDLADNIRDFYLTLKSEDAQAARRLFLILFHVFKQSIFTKIRPYEI